MQHKSENIHLQDINPAVELSHYEEIIEQRRKKLFGDMPLGAFEGIMLLDPEDRPAYVKCKAMVAQMETLEVMASRGVKTPEDLREHIQLVHDLSLNHEEISAAELRTFSLDLLRSMHQEVMSRRRA